MNRRKRVVNIVIMAALFTLLFVWQCTRPMVSVKVVMLP